MYADELERRLEKEQYQVKAWRKEGCTYRSF